jgi:hypothetical protein
MREADLVSCKVEELVSRRLPPTTLASELQYATKHVVKFRLNAGASAGADTANAKVGFQFTADSQRVCNAKGATITRMQPISKKELAALLQKHVTRNRDEFKRSVPIVRPVTYGVVISAIRAESCDYRSGSMGQWTTFANTTIATASFIPSATGEVNVDSSLEVTEGGENIANCTVGFHITEFSLH